MRLFLIVFRVYGSKITKFGYKICSVVHCILASRHHHAAKHNNYFYYYYYYYYITIPIITIDAYTERHRHIGRRTQPARGSRDQNPPAISADHITACPPYMAVDCRRLSLSCPRCPHLERPAAPRHVRTISACFPKSSEDTPFPVFFSVTFVQCLQSDSCHYWHNNRSFYLLTYLLTYLLFPWLRCCISCICCVQKSDWTWSPIWSRVWISFHPTWINTATWKVELLGLCCLHSIGNHFFPKLCNKCISVSK